MKFIKVAEIETTNFYDRHDHLLDELREAKKSGVNINEYRINHDGKSYYSIVDFLMNRTSQKYSSETFKEALKEKIIDYKNVIEMEVVPTIIGLSGKISRGEISYEKIAKDIEDNPKLSLDEAAAKHYPELVEHKIVFKVKADGSFDALLKLDVPGHQIMFNEMIQKTFYEASAIEGRSNDFKPLKLYNLEVREYYKENEFRTLSNISVNTSTPEHQALFQGLELFSDYPRIQKRFYEQYPLTKSQKEILLSRYVTENGVNSLTSISQFAFDNNIVTAGLKQDFKKDAVYYAFVDTIKTGDWNKIKGFYDTLENLEKGLFENQNSGRLNPLLHTTNSEIFNKMFEHMPEFSDPNNTYPALYKINESRGISKETIITIFDNIEKFHNFKEPKTLENLVDFACKNDYLEEALTKLSSVGVYASQMPDYSDILCKEHNGENQIAKNLLTAFEFGYNPSLIDKQISHIVDRRNKPQITALKKAGAIDVNGNIFLNSLIKNQLTSIFHSYFPSTIKAETLNFKNYDNSLLWWNAFDGTFLGKVKKFAESKPEELKINVSKSCFLNHTLSNIFCGDNAIAKSAKEIFETGLSLSKTRNEKIEFGAVDDNGKNLFHHSFKFYNFSGRNAGTILKSILSDDVLQGENFSNKIKEMLSQKDNQGKYPLDYFIDITPIVINRNTDNETTIYRDSIEHNKNSLGNFNFELKKLFQAKDNNLGQAFLEELVRAPNSHGIDMADYLTRAVNEFSKGTPDGELIQNIEFFKANNLRISLNEHMENNIQNSKMNNDDDEPKQMSFKL